MKFSFEIKRDVYVFRQNLDSRVKNDVPKKWLLFDYYSEGLNFTDNGKYIKGIYSDFEDEPGNVVNKTPFQVYFCGKIVERNQKNFFEGWIYPEPFQFVMITGLSFCGFSFLNWYSLLIIVPIYSFFLWCFLSLIKRSYKDLEDFVG